jgi:hypothetical protein
MFKKLFDCVSFNSEFIKEYCSDELLIRFGPSFLSKSGKYPQCRLILFGRRRNDKGRDGTGVSRQHRRKTKY